MKSAVGAMITGNIGYKKYSKQAELAKRNPDEAINTRHTRHVAADADFGVRLRL